MDRQYQGLPIRELGAGAGIRRPRQPQAARQPGVAAPQAGEVARTFAEIEAALGH